MKRYFLTASFLLFGAFAFSQEKTDSLQLDNPDYEENFDENSEIFLDEVIIISNPADKHFKDSKSLGSLDSYLEKSNSVNMIRRGAYAWEPMLQGMASERSVITVEGMRIYQACTDKMDPITSYIENSNLSEAEVVSGVSGSEHGGSIAGSIDLIRRKSGFTHRGFEGSAFAGYESVNKQQIYGGLFQYSHPKFFVDLDYTYRDAENYKAGGGKEVLYSQFRKYNISGTTGYKINAKNEVEASVIYDRAMDVGYPGLPMDVSLAEAFIGSFKYTYRNISELFSLWETKVYYNKVTHVMDDSHRPDVPIRMDMPGWSKTWGAYSKLKGNFNSHSFSATLSGHHNNSLAEMTMYPADPDEKEMFMLTWPDVNTIYAGLHLEDRISLNPHMILNLSGGFALHKNEIKSSFGLNSLAIFYPGLKADKSRTLFNLSSDFNFHHGSFLYGIGAGYGERAPSVSEAYGFYLFNANDGYDYVGNPYLKNEKSFNVFLSAEYKGDRLTAKWQGNWFHMMDYIVGKVDADFLPMNIVANGVKVYEGLSHATLFNTDLTLEYKPLPRWTLTGKVSYRYGEGAQSTKLPLIQPFAYDLGIRWQKARFFAEANIGGNARYSRYSSEFGETPKSAFAIVNAAASQTFRWKGTQITAKAGVENIFDKKYTTFSDWFNIPRPGRNIFVNLIFKI